PDYLPAEPPAQPTYLVVYRDRNDKAGFLELNPVSARLLELIREGGNATGSSLLNAIVTELQHPSPEVVINGGVEIMHDMLSKDILLGVKA
ncbi:MAG: HvfC family peptide modification chaperone, partial [Gammaproteobacteria bacterium]